MRILTLVFLLIPHVASAQSESSFAAQIFHPSAHGSSFFTVESGAIAPSLGVQASVFFDYANGPLEVARTSTTTFRLIEHRLDAQLAASVALFDRLSLALAFPVTLVQRGYFKDQTGRSPIEMNSSAGDLRFEPKVGLLDEQRHFLDLALLLSLGVPTGNDSAFAGDKSVTFAAELDVSRHFGPVRVGLNFGYLFRQPTRFLTATIGQELYGRAAVAFDFSRTSIAIPLEIILEAYARAALTRPFVTIVENPGEVVLGLRYKVLSWLALSAGAGRGLTGGYGSPVARAFFGLTFTPLSGWKPAEPPAPASAPLALASSAPATVPVGEPASAPAAVSPEAPIVLDADGILPERAYFVRRSDAVSPEAMVIVEQIARIMVAHPSLNLIVEGHSDYVGSEVYNLMLSQRRAEAIIEALVARGVPASRLEPIGVGSRKPLMQGNDKLARDKNRCVVFRPQPAKEESAK